MRGTTLIEVLLSIFIVGLLFTVVGSIIAATLRFHDATSLRSEVEREAVIGLEPIRDAGEAARAILSSRTINGTSYTSSSSTIVLDVPTVNTSGGIVTSSSDYVAFTRNSSDPTLLVRDIEAASGSRLPSRRDTIARRVSALSFFYASTTPAGSSSFEIVLVASGTTRGRSSQAALSSFVTLQNP